MLLYFVMTNSMKVSDESSINLFSILFHKISLHLDESSLYNTENDLIETMYDFLFIFIIIMAHDGI